MACDSRTTAILANFGFRHPFVPNKLYTESMELMIQVAALEGGGEKGF